MANGLGWNGGYLYGNSMFKEESWEANGLNSTHWKLVPSASLSVLLMSDALLWLGVGEWPVHHGHHSNLQYLHQGYFHPGGMSEINEKENLLILI